MRYVQYCWAGTGVRKVQGIVPIFHTCSPTLPVITYDVVIAKRAAMDHQSTQYRYKQPKSLTAYDIFNVTNDICFSSS